MITRFWRLVVKQCPYKPETDFGELAITTDGPVPDLHALAEAIGAITARPVSHEDFTTAVAALLPGGPRVATTWHTAGWAVEVAVEGRRMVTALRRPVARQRPHGRETDLGELAVTLAGPAPELHALAAQVAAITAEAVSREDFTTAVAALLPDGSQAITTWHVPGWTVEVTDAAVSR